jgi:hypothetical protein
VAAKFVPFREKANEFCGLAAYYQQFILPYPPLFQGGG